MDKPKLQLPSSVSIEISEQCNRKCPWCPRCYSQREPGMLPNELFYKVIDELATYDYDMKLGFQIFNEPLLDPRLTDFVAYARTKLPKCRLYIHTNGDLLTYEYWEKLQKAGITLICINQYDEDSVKRTTELKDRIPEEGQKTLDIKTLQHVSKRFNNRGGLLKKNRREVPVHGNCRKVRQLCVNYKGNVVLCCNDYFGVVSAGNVADRSAIELYNCEMFLYYRNQLEKKNRAELALCNKCDAQKQ